MFDAALELPPEERAVYLRDAAGDDAELREAVEELLRGLGEADDPTRPAAMAFPALVADLASAQSRIGERIGPYRIVAEAGRGGMGAVYVADRADDQYTSRVALKLLRPGLDDQSFVRRFVEERQILASLVHPRIARLYDGGVTDDGQPWFAMEYVEGLPIDEYCAAGKLSIERRLELFLQVCDTVAFAHTHGVIHRDLKPSNILIDDQGEARLVDFGIAKVTSHAMVDDGRSRAEQAMGTRQYASPEQIRGDPVTAANDVYSLGVVLYRLLTGVHPHRVTNQAPDAKSAAAPGSEPMPPSDAIAQRANDERGPQRATPRQRRLRGDLDAIVLKMLRTDPALRYATVDDVASDIRRHLGQWPVTAMRNSPAYRMRKFVARRATPLAWSAAALVVIGGTLSVQQWRNRGTALGAPGVGLRQVTFRGDVLEGAVTRDGRWLAFTTNNDSGHQVIVKDLVSDSATSIAAGTSDYGFLSWSPDSRNLIVSVFDPGKPVKTLVFPRSGGAPVDTLTFANAQWTRAADQYFQFAANWRSVAFRSVQGAFPELSEYHFETFSERLDWLQDVAERPGGRLFAVAMTRDNADSSRVWTLDIDSAHRHRTKLRDTTTTQRLLLTDRGDIGWKSLEWSVRGDFLYYVIQRPGETLLRRAPVGRDGELRGLPETVLSGLEWYTRLDGTDNGDLYFVRGGAISNIWVGRSDRATLSLRALSTGTARRQGAQLSPDGRRVAFVMRGNVYTADTESGIETKMTDMDSVVGQPAWSPDGRALAFAIRRGTASRVAVLRAGKLDVIDSSAISVDGSITWSADGRILYTAPKNRNFAVLHPTTGEEVLLMPADSAARGWVFSPRGSPYGQQIVFNWNRSDTRETGVYMIDLRTGNSRRLAEGTSVVALGWAAGGRAVWVLDRSKREVLEVPLDGSKPRELARLGMEVTDGSISSGQIALEVTNHQGDVWVIEDLSRRRRR